MITALCGGVGGAKLVSGLSNAVEPRELTVVVNTGDDLTFCGLHVSPDLDTVTYTLAGLAGPQGWGMEGDSFQSLGMLERYGVPSWFRVGDRDLATHVYRTAQLREGASLSAITYQIRSSLGVKARVLPMSDGHVATRLLTAAGWLQFQEYFVARHHQDAVNAIEYDGVESALPAPDVVPSVLEAEVVVLANSNPALSIGPILALPGVRGALRETRAARVAVSPLVGNDAVSGPAGTLMRVLGHEPTPVGVATFYAGLIDGIVIDTRDAYRAPEIEELGMQVLCTDVIMKDGAAKARLAREVLEFAGDLK